MSESSGRKEPWKRDLSRRPWDEDPIVKEWHHFGWKCAGFLTSKLDEAGIDNCLWGTMYSMVMAKGERFRNVEFVVPDSQFDQAIAVIVELGGKLCSNTDSCASNPEAPFSWRDKWLQMPLPLVHLHHKDDETQEGWDYCPVWLSPQSRYLWFLPDLKLDNRNILLVEHLDFAWRMGLVSAMIPVEYMKPARAPAPHVLAEAAVRMYVRDKGLMARGFWEEQLMKLMDRETLKCVVRVKRMPPHIAEFFRRCRTASWMSVKAYRKLLAADPSLETVKPPPNYSRPRHAWQMPEREDRTQEELGRCEEYYEGRVHDSDEETDVKK